MEEKKKQKPALSIDEQIENMKQHGLVIKDDKYARKILKDISYYRLIKAYSLNLKEKNSDYNGEVTFEQIVELYSFNAEFRHLLFPLIEKIEINLRCRIGNYFGVKYGVVEYKNSDNFSNESYHNSLMVDINNTVKRNSKSPIVENFKNNYEGGYLPIYALIELFSFGMLSKFYKNMKNEDKGSIAKQYNLSYKYLESWLECISYIRNVCAHYGRLYNINLIKKPKIYNEYKKKDIKNDKIFAVILCIKHIINDDSKWEEFIHNLEGILGRYKCVDITLIGFPPNWKEVLLG